MSFGDYSRGLCRAVVCSLVVKVLPTPPPGCKERYGGARWKLLAEQRENRRVISSLKSASFFFFFFFFILRRMGKNKALAHHTSTYFHTRVLRRLSYYNDYLTVNTVVVQRYQTHLRVCVWRERHGMPQGQLLAQQLVRDVRAHRVVDKPGASRVPLREICHV